MKLREIEFQRIVCLGSCNFAIAFAIWLILLLFKVCVKKNLRLLNYFSESYALTKLQNGL